MAISSSSTIRCASSWPTSCARAGCPLWDPYTFGGEPAVAMSLFAPYYPPGLWQVIFPQPFPFEALETGGDLPSWPGRPVHLPVRAPLDAPATRRPDGRPGLLARRFLTSYPMLQLIILEAAVWLPAGSG